MIFSASFMDHDDRPNRPLSFDGGGSSADPPAKRPRGRPPGSKNKPKSTSPAVIARESQPSSAMRPHVLEISAGHDIIDSLSTFSTSRSLGVCVLSATGSVSNVTLRQPMAGPTVGFRGRFDVLSLSATFFPPGMAVGSPGGGMAVGSPGGGVTVSLAGPGGQVIGGAVVGPVVAAGTVTVVAAGFENPTFHRLPVEEDDVSAGEDPYVDDVSAAVTTRAETPSREVLIYGSGFAADAMWGPHPAPLPRPPPF